MKEYRVEELGNFKQDNPNWNTTKNIICFEADGYYIEDSDIIFFDKNENEIKRFKNTPYHIKIFENSKLIII